jgi:hypothetical protein
MPEHEILEKQKQSKTEVIDVKFGKIVEPETRRNRIINRSLEELELNICLQCYNMNDRDDFAM